MSAPAQEPGSVRPRRPTKLALLVAEFIRTERPRMEASWRWYASAGSLKEAIRRAALSVREDGQVEEHQRDVPERLRVELAGRIALLTPVHLRTFDELLALVLRAAPARVPPQTTYDVACRIGAFLRVRPDRVFLSARAREGAHSLRIVTRRDQLWMAMPAYPEELRLLRAGEVAELLNEYRDVLVALRRPERRNIHPAVDCGRSPPSRTTTHASRVMRLDVLRPKR